MSQSTQDIPPKPSGAKTPPQHVRTHESRHRLILHTMISAIRRWWFHTFQRRNLRDSIKTFLIVGSLTMLIWVWAETQQTVPPTPVDVALRVVCSDPDRIVTLKEPSSARITIKITGPKTGVDSVTESLTHVVPGGIEVDLGSNLSVGSRPLLILDRIRNLQIFREKGVSVIDVVPSTMTVDVDQVIGIEKDVRIPSELADKIDGPPIFDPPRVRVRGPGSLLSEKPDVYADLHDADVKTPGPHDPVSVPLITRLNDPRVVISPNVVKVTLKVKQLNDEWVKNTMPIWVEGSVKAADQVKVVLDTDFLADVKLVGPPDIIAAMQKENFTPQPHAVLEINSDDPRDKHLTRKLRFAYLPEGVIVNIDESKKEVGFKLVPRE